MIVGVPREIKADEYRVAMIPVGVEELRKAGHTVLVQSGAGQGSGISDERYAKSGAQIVADAATIWKQAELIVKVKEPLADEWSSMRSDQVVFTYFHFAADEKLTRAVLNAGIVAVAYETIKDARGGLPLLTPMSEVAGRMSIQEGRNIWSALSRGEAFCWVACPVLRRHRWWCWAAALSAQTRPKSPRVWVPTFPFSTSISTR